MTIKTKQGLADAMRRFEYVAPQPLSKIPSIALRQAADDVERVTAAGAIIAMGDWCVFDTNQNDRCEVCLAGAVLLARGHMRKFVEQEPSYTDGCVQAARNMNSGRIVGTYAWPSSSMAGYVRVWDTDADASVIADVLNDLRSGYIGPFLRDWCGLTHEEVERLPSFPVINYGGVLSNESIATMLAKLRQIADILEANGR